MGVKYTIPYRGNDNVSWRVDIISASWMGESKTIRGVSEQCALRAYDVEQTDDPFSTFIPSSLTLNIYDRSDIDVNELQQAQDRDFVINQYRENVLKWSGFLVPDNITLPFKPTPRDISLKAICGLSMLSNLVYTHNDLPGLTGEVSRCPMNYFRNILFLNLGVILPIRWTNNLHCTAFPDEDVFTESVRWGTTGEAFISYQSSSSDSGPQQTCEYILKGLLQAMQCRIFQDNGMWIIRRVPDIVTGSIVYKQISATLGVFDIQESTQSFLRHIGITGYRMVQEDAIITVRPGFKTCKVTYNANVRENIVPNGGQDLIEDTLPVELAMPLYWGDVVGGSTDIFSQQPSLNGRVGYSTEIDGLIDLQYFTMGIEPRTLGENGLPIDTKVQIKRINFGFLFSPIAFPILGGGEEIIDWTSNPMPIQVILNLFGVRYWLNEYGFWVTSEYTINITIDNLRLHDVAQVNFDHFQGIIMPEPTNVPEPGDESNIQIVFVMKPGIRYYVDDIHINIDSGNDIYESTFEDSRNTITDEREIAISSSFSGYMLSNLMTSPFDSDEQCYYRDGFLYEGTLTGLTANAIMRYRYKSSRVFNGSISTKNLDWSFDQLYTIDTLGSSKFLPLNANFNSEKCECSLVAIECRNDFIPLTEKYYSSNDQQLSN
jgi:hypothetical protein